MRQLRTCDFCGDEAVGTFEIVPPELNPSEAEQRRVVLCAGCQPTLEELLEPLLARAGADASTDATGGESESDDGADSATGDADTDDGGRSAANDGSRATAPGDTTASGTTGIDGTDGGASEDESAVPGAVVTPDTDERSVPDADEGVAIGGGRAGRDRNDGTASAVESNGGSDRKSITKSERAAAPGTGMTPQGGDAETPSPPRAYGKVLRLLQNREFPMARSDVEGLAAGAYDLEDDEVDAIIEHAVEQGDLELDGRQIRLA